MTDDRAGAEVVQLHPASTRAELEAIDRLKAAVGWLRHVENGDCDPTEGREAARVLCVQAQAWLGGPAC